MENAATPSRWIRWPIFLLIALAGLVLRLPQLGVRPMHTDEAVNAYIVGQILSGEPFNYDPQDRHGPALAAFAVPLARLQGAKKFSDLTESELRLTSALAGTVTILLLASAGDVFGMVPCLIAALLFAGGPLAVYYDRFFIHESLFCTATLGLIVSGWRVCQRPAASSALMVGACSALMLACKETAIIHFVSVALAGLAYRRLDLRGKRAIGLIRQNVVLLASVTFVLITVTLFTWFGKNWKSLSALLQVAPDVLARAAGQGHQKAAWYYFSLLATGRSGWVLLALAAVGLFLTFAKSDHSALRLLAYYAILVAVIYSLIPYKTPWLALNLWLPLALFAGRTIEWSWQVVATRLPSRAAIPAFAIFGTAAAALIAHDTRQRVFLQPADETNPYAYAHTSDDLLGLAPEIEQLARQSALTQPRIAVIAHDVWPLPWYLRHFSQVGFWQPGQQIGNADFYITSTDAAEQYSDRLRDFRPEFFGARPGVLVLLWSPAPK